MSTASDEKHVRGTTASGSSSSIMANVTVQVSRFLASGKKLERLQGQDFGYVSSFLQKKVRKLVGCSRFSELLIVQPPLVLLELELTKYDSESEFKPGSG